MWLFNVPANLSTRVFCASPLKCERSEQACLAAHLCCNVTEAGKRAISGFSLLCRYYNNILVIFASEFCACSLPKTENPVTRGQSEIFFSNVVVPMPSIGATR